MNDPFVRPEISVGLRPGCDPLCHVQRDLRTGSSGLRREHYLATSVSWLVGAALVFVAFASNAAEDVETPVPTSQSSMIDATAATVTAAPVANEASAPPLGMGLAVASDILDSSRGGTEVQLNDIRVQGSLHDASASELQTGSNLITTGAFANAVGFPMTIQNSGNNVLIQNATIINVTPY